MLNGGDSALAGAIASDRRASLARSGCCYVRWIGAGAVDAGLARTLLAEDALALGLIACPDAVMGWLGDVDAVPVSHYAQRDSAYAFVV